MRISFDLLRSPKVLAPLFVLLAGYLSIVQGYWNPPNLFWDENYHVASAQKYMNGVYFMEPHPPLGKLLIAAGEVLLNRNAEDNQFLGTDYGKSLPQDFSFAGYRFFPVILAWLTVPLLYFIFLLLTGRRLSAMFLSFLPLFDNALIVHARAAMLDGILLFFITACILFFLLLLRWKNNEKLFRYAAIGFGAAFGCIAVTKANGLVVALLGPALLVALWPNTKRCLQLIGWSALAAFLVYVSVWQIHFSLGVRIMPGLPDSGYYQASEEYKKILDKGKGTPLTAFPMALGEHVAFLSHYANGVPRLDMCKADENGSPWFFWPLGGRSINYRWETPDSLYYRYLYLQVNPVVWWSSFAAVLAAIALLGVRFFFPLQQKLKRPFLLMVFTGLYLAYMVAIARLDRVMYLYHYFPPLLFSFCIFALMSEEITHVWKWKIDEWKRNVALLCLGMFIFAGYQFYRPFTYYEPLKDEQVQRRAFFGLWELHCVNCPRKNALVVPRK